MNSEAKNTNIYKISKPSNIITFRNNIGMYYDERGFPVCYGVAGKPDAKKPSLGGSDFIGWESVIITPDMVGKRVAIFRADEIKADDCNEGTVTIAAQENFIRVVNAAGGRAGFVRRPIDIELIDDSVFNVEGWASRRGGRGWGLSENKYYLMGTGSGQTGTT